MERKKILIITYYYYPDNSIGAVRPTKVCKYLSDEYDIDILTVKRDGNKHIYDGQNAINVYEIEKGESIFSSWIVAFRKRRIYQNLRKIEHQRTMPHLLKRNDNKVEFIPTPKGSLLRELSVGVLLIQTLFDDFNYYMGGKKVLRRCVMKKKYDYIISEFPTMSDHLFACMYKKKNPNTKWIADFRDPVLRESMLWLNKIVYKKCMKTIEKHADMVLTINENVLEELNFCRVFGKILSNGYDIDDISSIKHNDNTHNNNKMTFLYTGTLYPQHSSLRAFFYVIRMLINEKIVDKDSIAVIYAGTDYAILERQAKEYKLIDILYDCGMVTREESLAMQRGADVLLLASWNDKIEKGVVTGKFFEYITSGHPIIACITGNGRQSLLKELIENHGLGICCEEAGYKNDLPLLKEYVKSLYIEFVQGGESQYKPDKRYIESLRYDKLVSELKDMISEL